MPVVAPCVPGDADLPRLRARFLAALARIERHARLAFRHVKCPVQQEEARAEAVALAWLWFVRLARRDIDAGAFVSALARYAARAVRSGRRLCGQEKAQDVLSPRAQRRCGFRVAALPVGSAVAGHPYDEALQDNTQTPVPEQVSFRCDFPQWRRTRTRRDRRLMDALMRGERACDVARAFGLSAARVAQLRRAFHADWRRFTADPADAAPAGAAPRGAG
jgi:hypothetical protein